MSSTKGSIHFEITADNDDLKRKLAESRQAILNSGDTAQAEGSKIEGMFKRAAMAAGGFLSIDIAKNFGMQLIEITGKFQTFQAVLTNTLQSPQKAKEAMSMLQEFAATTPFHVDDLTGAFVKLANQGFVPTYDEMVKLGDLASSTGKGFDQLSEAIIDAQTGEFERLKEFGIRASKEGDQVTFTFKEQKTQVDFTASSIRDYVLSLGELSGVQGANAEIAKTLTGQMSNLEDGITQMMNEIGQSSQGALSGALSGASMLVENYEAVGAILSTLVVTYGTYKAAIITVNAIQTLNNAILRQAVIEKKLAAMAGVQLSSSQAVSAASTKMLSIAQQGLVGSIKAVGTAMMANPYALVAAAIAGIGYVLYKVISAQSEFDKAQERLKTVNQEVTLELTSEIRQLNELERRLAQTKKGSQEYNDVKNQIVDNYGKYNQNLDAEIDKVGNLSTVYETLVEKIRLSIGARKAESFFKVEQENLDKVISDTLDSAYGRLTKKYGKDKGLSLYKEFFNNIQYGTTLSTEALEAFQNTNVADMRWGINAVDGLVDFRTSIDQMRTDINKTRQATRQNEKEFLETYQMTEQQMADIISGGEATGKSQKSTAMLTLSQVVADIKIADAKLTELRKKSKAGKVSDQDVQEQENKLNTLKASYKLKTGENYDPKPDKSKPDKSEAEKANQEYLEMQQQLREQSDEVYFDTWQNKIDIEKEGFEKLQHQNELNYSKELVSIEKYTNAKIKAYQDAERGKYKASHGGSDKGFVAATQTIEDLPQELQNNVRAKTQNATANYDNANKKILNDLLLQYQSYADQRKAIEEQFDADITSIQNSSASQEIKDSALVELEKRRKEATDSINDQAFASMQKSSKLLVGLFEDTADKSIEEIDRITEMAQELLTYLDAPADTTIIPPLGFTAEQLLVLKNSPEQIDKIRAAVKKLGEETDSKNPFTALSKSINEIFKGKKSTDSAQEKLASLGSAAAESADMVGDLAGKFSDMFAAAGNDQAAKAMDTIQGVMTSVSNIGQGFAKGGLIGGIGAAIGEVASWLTKLFKAQAEHEKALKEIKAEQLSQQREYNLLLMEQSLLYEKGNTIFGADAYGKAANSITVMKEALTALNKELSGQAKNEQELERTKYRRGSGGTNVVDYGRPTISGNEVASGNTGLKEIKIKTGHTKKDKDIYTSVLEMYPKLIGENDKFNISLAKTIISTREMSEEDKMAFQSMIDYAEMAEKALEQVKEYLSSIFGELGNTMSNALVDSFKNGTDAAGVFYDSVASMLETLAEQMVYSVTLAPLMKKAEEDMLGVMEDTTLSDEEKFKKQAQIIAGLTGEAIAQQDKANELYKIAQDAAAEQGVEIFKPDQDQREGVSKRGIATASQESVDENNGRLTAIQGHTYELNETLKFISPNIASIKDSIDFIRDNAANQLIALYAIRDNTAPIAAINADITAMRADISTLVIHGVAIR